MNIFVNIENGESAMVFTENPRVTPDMILELFEDMEKNYGGGHPLEAYAVPQSDCQYYCYEPIWLDEDQEMKIIEKYGNKAA